MVKPGQAKSHLLYFKSRLIGLESSTWIRVKLKRQVVRLSCHVPFQTVVVFVPLLTNGSLCGLRGVGLDSSNDESISTPSLPNTFLGGGCPKHPPKAMVNGGVFGGSQGIRKTSHMFIGGVDHVQ